MTGSARPTVVLACGYFDWFSGYQETVLATALAAEADVTVVAGNRVNPLFTDEHLERLGVTRTYPTGVSAEQGVKVLRLPTRELRSMLWSRSAKTTISRLDADLVVQVMPGQILPAAASWARVRGSRHVLYGDNAAMYAGLPPLARTLKTGVFLATKGLLYRAVNQRADHLYGYTPNTIARLRRVAAGRRIDLLPLSYDDDLFFPDDRGRELWRQRYNYRDDEVVVLVAGKVRPQKRADAALRAVASLRDRGSDIRMHVVGGDAGPTTRALRRLADDLGHPSALTIEGFVPAPSLAEAFNGADVGVWPSMPAITIQQAMGSGLPVVLPDNDLVSHLVASPRSGALLRPDRDLVPELARALTSVCERPRPTGIERRRVANAAAWLSPKSLAHRLLSDAGLAP